MKKRWFLFTDKHFFLLLVFLANLALAPRLRAQVARHADINCIIDVLGGAFFMYIV